MSLCDEYLLANLRITPLAHLLSEREESQRRGAALAASIEYNRIFNSHERFEPAKTLQLIKQSNSNLRRLPQSSSTSRRIYQTRTLIDANEIDESACEGSILAAGRDYLSRLIEEQQLLFKSKQTAPAIHYMSQMYEQQMSTCQKSPTIKRGVEPSLASLGANARSLLNHLADE